MLGNAKNRRLFKNIFWWDKDIGLSTYLAEVAGTPQVVEEVDPETGARSTRPPRIVTAENPPRSQGEALRRWRQARSAFLAALAKSRTILAAAEKIREFAASLARLAREEAEAEAAAALAGSAVARSQAAAEKARSLHAEALAHRNGAEALLAEHDRRAPGLFARLLWIRRAREWRSARAPLAATAFLDAAAKPLRHNLGVLMSLFGGRALPTAEKRALIPDLWTSLFLAIPLISTTFASVERMLRDLPPESLGWLFVDEAGQAVPPAAVGAIFRSRRAVVVGDPMKIAPVVTLPDRLTQVVCRQFGADPHRFNAPDASVQTLADAASPFLAEIESRHGSRGIGVPPLVHHRCSEPMFGISNAIAYEYLMVNVKQEGSSPIGELLGPSRWIDVGGSAEEKWCPEEGLQVLELLRKLAAPDLSHWKTGAPDLYIVTPFVVVAERLRKLVGESALLVWADDSRRWTFERIGTVHTVQGREAEAVIFILGAPAPGQTGARAWAGGKPNLINVAVTRAKERLYIVGNRGLWRQAGLFSELDARLPPS